MYLSVEKYSMAAEILTGNHPISPGKELRTRPGLPYAVEVRIQSPIVYGFAFVSL